MEAVQRHFLRGMVECCEQGCRRGFCDAVRRERARARGGRRNGRGHLGSGLFFFTPEEDWEKSGQRDQKRERVGFSEHASEYPQRSGRGKRQTTGRVSIIWMGPRGCGNLAG